MKYLYSLSVVVAMMLFGTTSQSRQKDPDQFRIREIAIEGAVRFTQDQVIAISGLNLRSIAAPQMFDTARKRILRAYNNRGCIQAQVSITSRYTPPPPEENLEAANILVKIDEGPVFTLRRLEFVGNKTTRDFIVRRRVLLNEGEPYSEDLLEMSIERLNRLGLFGRVTKNDVRFELDRAEKIVDLRIFLKENKK